MASTYIVSMRPYWLGEYGKYTILEHMFASSNVTFLADAKVYYRMRIYDHVIKLANSVITDPIPNLYSAGEFGSVWCDMYNGGGNLGECCAFGRIAVRNVLGIA